MISLKDKTILITGGARGLGAATARSFAAEGANIAINYLSAASRAESLAEELRNKYNVSVITLQGDVGKEEECNRLVKETLEGLGRIDVIISNAVSKFSWEAGERYLIERRDKQGWTKFSDFGDLNALTEEEWDKVFLFHPNFYIILSR
jgi:NAD(P)-dependent dehydrogenase (short-subunit alcohol dehydrogenase family)